MVDYSTPRGGVPMLAEYSQIQIDWKWYWRFMFSVNIPLYMYCNWSVTVIIIHMYQEGCVHVSPRSLASVVKFRFWYIFRTICFTFLNSVSCLKIGMIAIAMHAKMHCLGKRCMPSEDDDRQTDNQI